MVEKIFSTCRHALGSETWGRVLTAMDGDLTIQSFPDMLASLAESMELPGYIADLACLEWILHKKTAVDNPIRRIQTVTVNPTLTMVPVPWKNLTAFIRSNATGAAPLNEPAHVIVWRHPESKDLHFREARDIDLLALKLIIEQIDPKEAARLGKVTPGDIQTAIDQAISLGFLLSPGSRIRRAKPPAGEIDPSLASFLSAEIFSMVMLTLTRDNLAQVLPLAKLLEDRADAFTFNRLSTVGKGATLLMPEKAAFESFLREYDAAAAKNPKMGLKDNLINIIRQEKSAALFGGCTGHGCGAAFNFLGLLPDGEVHACRKFPSLVGNITKHRLYDIYNSDLTERYRAGSRACRSCRLNPVCRGCLAIAFSLGLDIFKEKGPFCFASQQFSGA